MTQNEALYASRMNFTAHSDLDNTPHGRDLHLGSPKNAEFHVADDGDNLYTVPGTIHPLNRINEGFDPGQRVSSRITMESVRIVGDIKYRSESTVINGAFYGFPVRMAVVYDKWPTSHAVHADYYTVFSTEPDGVAPYTNLYSMLNLKHAGRFIVLHDSVMTLSPPTFAGTINAATGNPWGTTEVYHHFDIHLALDGLVSQFINTGPQPVTGHLTLYVATGVIASTPGPALTFQNCSARLQYRDQ